MDTLNDIIDDLKNIALSRNYSGPTIDALTYMMASGIYKNELKLLTTSQELSESNCKLLNSSIQHAQDKAYSVFRGKNQHIIINNVVPNEKKMVSKYDTCTKIGKYKLVYAKDYDFTGNYKTGSIELILCESVIEETLVSSLRKYTRSTETDLTEDLDLYVGDVGENNATSVKYVNDLDIGLNVMINDSASGVSESYTNGYLNSSTPTPYLILTDTDFGIICWCYQEGHTEMVFDTNHIYSIRSPKYLNEEIDIHDIRSLPGFDITEALENIDNGGIVSIASLVRESSPDNVFIESTISEHSGNIIRSIDDIPNIFLSYFAKQNIRSCKSYFSDDGHLKIVYLQDDKNKPIDESYIQSFKRYLKRAFYVSQPIDIEKAWACNNSDYNIEKFEFPNGNELKTRIVKLIYPKELVNSLGSSTVELKTNEYGYIELPNLKHSYVDSEGKKYSFIGWAEDDTKNYALTGLYDNSENVQAIYYPKTDNIELKAIYASESESLIYLDLYKSANMLDLTTKVSDFYQRIVVKKNSDGFFNLDYEPVVPYNSNGAFIAWEDPLTESVNTSLKKDYLTHSMRYIATWTPITYTVNLVYMTDAIRKTLDGLMEVEAPANNQMQGVISGNLVSPPEIPSYLSQKGYKLKGWYYHTKLTSDYKPEDGDVKKKFDIGTPITDNITLLAEYEQDYDLDLEIYFDAPLDNAKLNTFIDNYSYNIGEEFEPMKVATQLSKEFEGITWVNFKEGKTGSIKIPNNAYCDFKYRLRFNNDIKGV